MKKIVKTTITVILILVSVYFAYTYYNGPKIIEGVTSKSIDGNGKAVGLATEFSPEETIYFSAKSNRFWIRKAQIVWYKGKVSTANRVMVEDDIAISSGGYFSTKLSLPGGFEEGRYSISIYVAGKEIIETSAEFDVKR